MALLSRFFGRTASEGAAFALGVATGPVLAPAVEEVKNEAWRTHPARALEPGDAAEIVAEDVERRDWGAGEAAAHGVNGDRFDALVGAVLNAPGMGEMLQARRRGLVSDSQFRHGLRKARLETVWDAALVGLLDVLLTPAELANARQQGYIDQARQHSEAALQGVSDDRAEIQFEMVGLPPGHAEAQQMLNRGLIDQGEFAEMIREGRTKTKYTTVIREAARYVLSPTTYIDARIRGWIDEKAMTAGVGLHGVSSEDADLLFKVHGRPLAWRQVFIGIRRGGKYDGPTGNIPDPILKAFEQSSLRPEWYNLAFAAIESYPSVLAIRALAQTGDLSTADTIDVLLKEGWNEAFARQVAGAWTTKQTGGTDTHTAKAQVQLWTTTHRSYLAGEITKTVARNALGQAGVAAGSITSVLGTWDAEKALIRAQLTPANVKKAFQKGARNNATGKPWTRDEALAALVDLGYAPLAANDYLDIP